MTDAQPLAAGVADAPPAGIFRSLNFFNARLYFAGLLLSTIGSWVQLTATSYLVYRLTGRASDLGYNVAFQFLPMLVLGTWAGSFADRFDRRSSTSRTTFRCRSCGGCRCFSASSAPSTTRLVAGSSPSWCRLPN
ncbi:MAG: hypothetical protein EBT46_02755 [Actinobacteria bacterium]|nr:hypothetical protein [Actinomycetota bacterium]